MYRDNRVAVVIPYYNASAHIENVVSGIPDFIDRIIIVNDKSPDNLPDIEDSRLLVVEHDINQGVGGATVTGFSEALKDGADIVVKMDADNQMDPVYLPDLIDPLVDQRAGYSKGNRFRDFKALSKMPLLRRMGNLGLSFLAKIATGYWNNFDPTNGYFAIKRECLVQLDFSSLSKRFFFETSLLAQLYFHNTVVFDVAMPSKYGDEKSTMNIWNELISFPLNLMKTLIKRVVLKYFIYDFNMASMYILTGFPLLMFGTVYGLMVWIRNASKNVLTPTGTIMLITLTIILGFQLILQAIHIDISNSPSAEKRNGE